MRTTRRAGFTLLEVLVAVVLTGTVALLAHQLFAAAVDGSRRVEQARRRLDREGNARAFLRDALLALEVGADSAGSFEGEPRRLRFSARLPTSHGWDERRTVDLSLAGGRWTAALGEEPGTRLVLADSVRSVELDYLLEPGADVHWVMDWHSPVSAPLAVRVRLTRAGGACDTMLYLVKPRG
jgi:prepilin-type N-terminal cleavage/methylation domain-containing protein